MNQILDLKYWVIDVDGTMTDAGIYYDDNGNELKKFCTKDAAGFFAAHQVDVKIIVLTGRECYAVRRRMEEMKVDFIFQNVKDKKSFLVNFMKDNNISKNEIGYIGDDLNDFMAMKLVGFVGCPSDACVEIKEIADYISCVEGGKGAVRDIIEYVLRKQGIWKKVIEKIYY